MNLGNDNLDTKKLKEYLSFLNLNNKFILNDQINDFEFGLGGKELSTGEKQRILIIKAFLSRFDLLLMDESTSSVDKESINQIRFINSFIFFHKFSPKI